MASFNNDPRTIMQSDDFKQSQRKITDRLSLLDIANEFKDRKSNRKRNFGIFIVSDVK